MLPRRQRARELSVVHIIQKSCRGYLDRKKISNDRQYQKMLLNFDYFDKVKAKMVEDNARFIFYYIKKHFYKMREVRAKEYAKK